MFEKVNCCKMDDDDRQKAFCALLLSSALTLSLLGSLKWSISEGEGGFHPAVLLCIIKLDKQVDFDTNNQNPEIKSK